MYIISIIIVISIELEKFWILGIKYNDNIVECFFLFSAKNEFSYSSDFIHYVECAI